MVALSIPAPSEQGNGVTEAATRAIGGCRWRCGCCQVDAPDLHRSPSEWRPTRHHLALIRPLLLVFCTDFIHFPSRSIFSICTASSLLPFHCANRHICALHPAADDRPESPQSSTTPSSRDKYSPTQKPPGNPPQLAVILVATPPPRVSIPQNNLSTTPPLSTAHPVCT